MKFSESVTQGWRTRFHLCFPGTFIYKINKAFPRALDERGNASIEIAIEGIKNFSMPRKKNDTEESGNLEDATIEVSMSGD